MRMVRYRIAGTYTPGPTYWLYFGRDQRHRSPSPAKAEKVHVWLSYWMINSSVLGQPASALPPARAEKVPAPPAPPARAKPFSNSVIICILGCLCVCLGLFMECHIDQLNPVVIIRQKENSQLPIFPKNIDLKHNHAVVIVVVGCRCLYWCWRPRLRGCGTLMVRSQQKTCATCRAVLLCCRARPRLDARKGGKRPTYSQSGYRGVVCACNPCIEPSVFMSEDLGFSYFLIIS